MNMFLGSDNQYILLRLRVDYRDDFMNESREGTIYD